MEAPEYFDNVTIGQFVLTGVPVKVYVNDHYLTITDPDDVADSQIGYGMDENGEMDVFDYRLVSHLLVAGNHIDLETYTKALDDDGEEEDTTDEPEEEDKEEEEDDEEQKEESIMKVPALSELARKQLKEAYLPSNIKQWAKERGPEAYKLANKVAGWIERLGKRVTGGTAIGKYYSTLVFDIGTRQGVVHINLDTDAVTISGADREEAYTFNEFKKLWMASSLAEITQDQKQARIASAKADMEAAKEKEMKAKREKVTESMLNEGQFSWFTHNTGKQIGSEPQNTIDVTMYDNEGNEWNEKNYEGYGEFGGKDYYELLAEMNGYTQEDVEMLKKAGKLQGFHELRQIGIDIAFGKMEPATGEKVVYPALIETERGYWNWRSHDFTEKPEDDPNQSWYQQEDDEDAYGYDEFGDDDDYYNENVSLNESIDIDRWKKIANIK